jgi:small-conductance mechanosensitive channel
MNPSNPSFRQLFLILMLCCWSTYGLAHDDTDHDNQIIKQGTAPVIVNGKVLFDLRGIRSFTADKRADAVSSLITKIAADPANPSDKFEIRDEGDRVGIYYGDTRIMWVFDIDAEYEGIDNSRIAAEAYEIQICAAIESYRHDRSPDVIKENVILALWRTVMLTIVLGTVIWLFRRIDKIIEKAFKRRIRKLEAKSMRIVQAEQIWRVVSAVFKLVKLLLILAVIYGFMTMVLNLFPWTRYYSTTLLQLILDPLAAMGRGVVGYLPSLFFLLMLYFVTRYLLKMMYSFFDAINRQNLRFASFESEWAWPTYRIIRVIVIIFAIVIAYPYIPGSDSAAFKGISIFLGVLLSLGSTSFISNIIAGYTMTYRRAFRIGDRVRIGDTVGTVTDIRLMVTNLLSLKNENIVIPNSTILNSEIVNYSTLAKEQGIILHTSVGIGYEVPWRQVEAMLLEAAARTEGLGREPEPFVLQKALTDFAVTYELNVYSRDEKHMTMLYSDLHRNIQDVFNEHDVQIMTPNYVADTPEPKVVPPDQWYAEPAKKPQPDSAT